LDPRARRGLESFLSGLPEGERVQIQATRAYLDTLYTAALDAAPETTRWLVDKTPANAPAVRFIRELYPSAPLIILRRHPAAIAWSHAQAFFSGDLARARQQRPILAETIPALAPVIRGELGEHMVIDYEDLVSQPEAVLARIFRALGLADHPAAVNYGTVPLAGPADPMEIHKHDRPVPALASRWRLAFTDGARRAEVEAQLSEISVPDLAAWGWRPDQLWTTVEGASPRRSQRPSPYALGRGALLWLRKDIHQRPHGRVVVKIRDACDLLLR